MIKWLGEHKTRQQIGRKCFPDWKSGLGEHIETRQEIGRKFQILRYPKPHWWPTADSIWVINELLNYTRQPLRLKMSDLEPEESVSDELVFSVPSVLSWVSETGSPAQCLLRRSTTVGCSLSGTVFASFLGGIADFHTLEKAETATIWMFWFTFVFNNSDALVSNPITDWLNKTLGA